MDAYGPHTDHKTARKAMSLEGFCSWTIMQDPTQQETQTNAFVVGDGRDCITGPKAPILDHQTFKFSAFKSTLLGRQFRSHEEVQQDVKDFHPSLGIDFYQYGFSKLISRYNNCINVG
ncbi:hypothetical protein AVEN_145235-1, partial [Araneus ventricosus]